MARRALPPLILALACAGAPEPAGRGNTSSSGSGNSRAGASASAGGSAGGATDQAGSTSASGGSGTITLPTAGASGAAAQGGGDPGTLPVGYTATDTGGFKLGAAIGGSAGAGGMGGAGVGGGCGTTILGVVRDFHADQLNFEASPDHVGDDKGLARQMLGQDQKPVYTRTGASLTVTGSDAFDQFYRSVSGVNLGFLISFFFAPKDGLSSFESSAYFPLDEQGFGNEGNAHNYDFTTEIHTQFRYMGGEKFNFTGADDVWVFINGKNVIDLGGVHQPESATIFVDALKLTQGAVYPLDIFHAQRHTPDSSFRADTNLFFVDCGSVIPDVPR